MKVCGYAVVNGKKEFVEVEIDRNEQRKVYEAYEKDLTTQDILMVATHMRSRGDIDFEMEKLFEKMPNLIDEYETRTANDDGWWLRMESVINNGLI